MRHQYPPPCRGVTLYYRLDRAAPTQQYKWRSKSWGLKISDLTPHSGPPLLVLEYHVRSKFSNGTKLRETSTGVADAGTNSGTRESEVIYA